MILNLNAEITTTQLQELIQIIDKLYHHDLNGYSHASLRRRIVRLMTLWKCNNYVEFKHELISGKHTNEEVLNEITVNTTEMFRDPFVFKSIQQTIFPYLKTFVSNKIWHAGCSTGEEMYSLAILLHEHGLLQKSIQYGTDLNTEVLNTVQTGIYNLREMKAYSENYAQSGGERSLSEYLNAKYGQCKFYKYLNKNFVLSQHDLIKGASFNIFNVIICRNVLIYFDKEAQEKVLKLFYESLNPGGYLILGTKESIRFSTYSDKFETVDPEARIFRKKIGG